MAIAALWIGYQLFNALAPLVEIKGQVVGKEVTRTTGKFAHYVWTVKIETARGPEEIVVGFYEWKRATVGNDFIFTRRAIFADQKP